MRIGILGAGRIGRIHCDNAIKLGLRVVACCDPFIDHAWAQAKSIEHIFSDEDEFFATDLDAVIIASPSTEHVRQTNKALVKNLHIFCEKPYALSLADHRELKEILAGYPKNFQMGFNRRFDNDFMAIKNALAQHNDARIYYVRITSRDPDLPSIDYLKQSHGMFFDMTIHDFDMARFMMGSDVTEVYARGAALIDPSIAKIGDIDTAVVTLKFANGAFGVIDNSRRAVYGYDQRVEVFGNFGNLSNKNHHQSEIVMSNAQGSYSSPLKHFFLERYQQSYETELRIFVDNCSQRNKSSPSIDDALAATQMAYAAQLSLKEQRPVRIEECL